MVGPAHLLSDPRTHADLRRSRTPRTTAARRRWSSTRTTASYIRTIWMPAGAEYGYDVRVNPHLNRMLTSSFTGRANYMRPLGELMEDAEAMKHFGNTMVVWDFHARKPLQTLEVPGAPLEIRWALRARATTTPSRATALTSKLWGVVPQGRRQLRGRRAGRRSAIRRRRRCPSTSASPPTTASCSSTPSWTARCASSTSRTPRAPKLVHEQKIGRQVNMVSQSWDGKRVYFTSSLLANWDKSGDDDEQFLRAFALGRQGAEPEVRDRLPRGRSSAARTSCTSDRRRSSRAARCSRR